MSNGNGTFPILRNNFLSYPEKCYVPNKINNDLTSLTSIFDTYFININIVLFLPWLFLAVSIIRCGLRMRHTQCHWF